MMPSVVTMQVNAASASSNMTNALEPPIPQPVLDILAAGALQEGPTADLPIDPEELLNKSAQAGLEWLEKCIPCNLRLQFRAELVNTLSDQFFASMEELLNNYLKELAFVFNVLRAPDVFQDACLLMRSMKDICIPDLQRMISLLASMIYRDSVREIAEFDILKFLITPIFQPLFGGITVLFGQYKSLITDPLQCVVANLGFHLDNLKTGGFLSDGAIFAIEKKSDELQRLGKVDGEVNETEIDANSQAIKDTLVEAKRMGTTLDEYNDAFQDTMGTAVFHLRRQLMVGIVEVESILGNLEAELQKLIGGSKSETTEFLIRQYEKLLLVRMISFISALIQALAGGFNCDTSNPDTADEVLNTFFDQYLGPQSPVEIHKDPVTNKIQLVLSSDALDPFRASITNVQEAGADGSVEADMASPPLVIEATGDNAVDQAVNAIIEQAATPVTIKPRCFFANTTEDSRLAQYIADLNAQEV
jgi:hypothetical protein